MERQLTIGRTTFLVRRSSRTKKSKTDTFTGFDAGFLKILSSFYCAVWAHKGAAGKLPKHTGQEKHHD